MITIYWIDESGENAVSRCFSEYDATRFEESLDAAGLCHSRAGTEAAKKDARK